MNVIILSDREADRQILISLTGRQTNKERHKVSSADNARP